MAWPVLSTVNREHTFIENEKGELLQRKTLIKLLDLWNCPLVKIYSQYEEKDRFC